MNELLNAIAIVWTPATLTAAVVAGVAMGVFVVGWVATNPAYASGIASPVAIARLVGVMGVATGVVFYVGQTVAAAADGDPGWYRIASRFGLWLVYAVCLAVGSWIRLSQDQRARRIRAERKARAELGT